MKISRKGTENETLDHMKDFEGENIDEETQKITVDGKERKESLL